LQRVKYKSNHKKYCHVFGVGLAFIGAGKAVDKIQLDLWINWNNKARLIFK